MKQSMIKAVSLLITLTFMVFLIAGCGGTTGAATQTGAPGTQGNAATQEVTQQAPAELNVLMYEVYSGSSYDNDVMNTIQQKTNTKLSFISIGADQKMDDKLNVIIASGERPDIMQFNGDDTEIKLTDANLLLPVSQYLDKMPNLNKYWSDLWPAMKHSDGNIYAVPVSQNLVQFAPVYRQDWLTKLGMTVPKTIDEYYNFAAAIAAKDPDGDGKADTYAFGGIHGVEDFRYTDHIWGAFGVLPDMWTAADGKLANNSVLPGAKAALAFLNKLYNAGAIDPEFLTDDWNRCKDKTVQGIYGAACVTSYVFEPSTAYYTDFHKNVPGGELALGTVLTAGSDSPVGMRKNNQRGWLKTGIYKDSKNLDAVFRLLDFLATDEGTTLQQCGFKDKTFTVDANGQITKTFDDNEAATLGIYQCTLAQRDLPATRSKTFIDVTDTLYKTAVGNQADALVIPEAAQYKKTLTDYTIEQFSKMIVGEVPVEGGFEDFVKEWNSMGGQALTDAYNKAYSAMAK